MFDGGKAAHSETMQLRTNSAVSAPFDKKSPLFQYGFVEKLVIFDDNQSHIIHVAYTLMVRTRVRMGNKGT